MIWKAEATSFFFSLKILLPLSFQTHQLTTRRINSQVLTEIEWEKGETIYWIIRPFTILGNTIDRWQSLSTRFWISTIKEQCNNRWLIELASFTQRAHLLASFRPLLDRLSSIRIFLWATSNQKQFILSYRLWIQNVLLEFFSHKIVLFHYVGRANWE